MATVLERVQTVVSDKLGVDVPEVVTEASFTEDLVELIMAFEEEFSTDDNPLEISDEDAEAITTVGKAIEYLHGQGIEDD